MASIDEAYLEMAGTERCTGLRCAPRTRCTPPSNARPTQHLDWHRAFATIAKSASDWPSQRLLWAAPGHEARLLASLDVRKIPGVGKVTEQSLHALGLRRIGDLAQLANRF